MVKTLVRRLRALVAETTRGGALDREMKDEFELHVELLAEDLVRRGVPRDDAVRQARLAFGNMTVAKENGRAANGLAWLDTLSQDVRFTLRTLRRHAGFTAVAVLSLGFGIGATTTMFSVVDALDFRPLPYTNADRLVWLAEVAPPDDRMCGRCASRTAPATVRDWISQVRSYDAVVVTDQTTFDWEHDDVEESPGAGSTTPGLLGLFGLRPVIGRDLEAADTLAGADPVVLLTYEFWKARLGGDPGVAGRRLRARIDGLTGPLRAVTIVGVMPKDFRIMPELELWSAMSLSGTSRTNRSATVIARLKPHASIASASAELQGLSARMASAYPAEYRGWTARVEPLRNRLDWAAGKGRGVLFAITLAVLLIAVLNVTGLLFARAAARQPEFAMRVALGAGRIRLFRQLVVEGSCVGVIGGLVGIGIAFAGVRVAARWFSIQQSGLGLVVDGRVLSFAVLLSLLVGMAAAVGPAARTARLDAGDRLGSRGTTAAGTSRTSSTLITAQIALALMLLTGAGLLSHDFLQLRYLDLGFDPRGVFETSVSAPREQWKNPGPWKTVAAETRARAAAVRGIQSASLEYLNAAHPSVVHSDVSREARSDAMPIVKAVDPDFFKTWSNPVLIGRAFAATDRDGSPPVAIVNKACASAFWPGQNPLGRRVFLGDSATSGEWLTVVGVTEDFERGGFARRHNPVVYRPFAQAHLYHPSVRISVRTAGDQPDALALAQSAIREVTGRPNAPFENADDRLSTRYLAQRFNAIALDAFAGFGLLLAAMGIYGSIAFAVTQRTREIGIRVALGAARSSVLGLIARRGVVVTAVGALVGVAGSFALTGVFRSFVSATSVTNPWIFVASLGVVLAVALVATFLPARRAAGVNPVIALRAD
jgi:putative ABC transport system permease protein